MELVNIAKNNYLMILDMIKAFAYAWIPSIILLWFLLARRYNSKVLAPLLSFVFAFGFAFVAARINELIDKSFSDNQAVFFGLVALNEEFIKFAGIVLGLLIAYIIYKIKSKSHNFVEIIYNNFLAIVLAAALGFAFAENFVYGISGQGSIARFIPLIAHCLFTYFAGVGLYLFFLQKNFLKKVFYLFSGFLQAVVIHAIYNISVSNDITLHIGYKLIYATVTVGLFVWIISSYQKFIKDQETEYILNNSNTLLAKANQDLSEQESNNFFINKNSSPEISFWKVLMTSAWCPGLAHWVFRKEFFNGLTFMSLAFFTPLATVLCALAIFSEKILARDINLQGLLIAFIVIAIVTYLVIMFWSIWEFWQTNNEHSSITPNDSKRRLSSIIPISVLFLIAIVFSLFLPVIQQIGSPPPKDPDTVIKEIPIGLEWEIAKEEVTVDEIKNTEDELTLESEEIQKRINEDKINKGIEQSKNNEIQKLDKLPEVGYIGVQLSQIPMQGRLRPYIVYVYDNTSAQRSGLQENDIILSVNGRLVEGIPLHQITKLVKGPIGTSVQLQILRVGYGEITITARRTGTVFNNKE